MKRAIIVHGLQGHPREAWFPYLSAELEKRKFSVSVPQLPNPASPDVRPWVAELAKTAHSPDENLFLIGHSLGCITILRYLESLQEGKTVGGVVMVSGFAQGIGIPEISSFFLFPINWAKIRSHSKKFTAINSDNDRHVPLKYGEELKEKLGAKLIIEKGAGHIGEGDKCRILPSVLKAVLEMSK